MDLEEVLGGKMCSNRLISAENSLDSHIYRREHRNQLSFKDFFLPFGGKLSGDNRWIKLAELIPWDELEDDYAWQSWKGFGAPPKLFRMMLWVHSEHQGYVKKPNPLRRS